MQKTDFNYEVCIGEDESNDGTRQICIKFAEENPGKIRLFLRSRKDVTYINGNPTGKFNFKETYRACKGKYIAYCEGDDYWTDPYKLQKQSDFLEYNPEYVLCFSNAEVENISANFFRKHYCSYKSDCSFSQADILRQGIHIPMLTMVFRKCLANFPGAFDKVYSGDTFLQLMFSGQGKFRYMNFFSGIYRNHDSSVTKRYQISKWLENTIQNLPGISDYILPENNKYFSFYQFNHRIWLIAAHFDENKPQLATEALKDIRKEFPWLKYFNFHWKNRKFLLKFMIRSNFPRMYSRLKRIVRSG